jgi:hypothetical protein
LEAAWPGFWAEFVQQLDRIEGRVATKWHDGEDQEMIVNDKLLHSEKVSVTGKVLAFVVLLFIATQANGAVHFIQSSTSRVDCGSDGVRPGDTITLAAGNRGPLNIRNCSGTAEKPITVRNDTSGSGPTVIRRTSAASGGFVFSCTSCVHVVIDGTGGWKGAPEGAYCGAPAGKNGCGIKVTSVAAGDAPTAYFKLNGMTTKVSVRGIEVDGRRSSLNTLGIGFDQNDHSVTVDKYPDFWREECVYEMNYVHDVDSSGMYIGPNWREPDLRVPLRNMTVRNNLIEDTGRDGIKLKSAIEGTNKIHHNVVRRTGLRGESGFGAGIVVTEGGSNLKLHNNWIESTGLQGIQHYNGNVPSTKGPFTTELYNNVVYETGRSVGATTAGNGITVAVGDGNATISPNVFNNTVVRAANHGISLNSRIKGGVVRDNIVSEWGNSALSLSGNTSSNNLSAAITTVRFADAASLNFQLRDDSPARDKGTSADFPRNDFRDFSRPQGKAYDLGAFEFSSALAEPRAPAISVE